MTAESSIPETAMPTIASALDQARRRLAGLHDSARLDAEVLLARVLNRDRSYLHAWPERTLSQEQALDFQQRLARRAAGEPLAYLTGEQEFWSLRLVVSPDTLVPRPETERLVELALERLPDESALTVADLGTGSGAIALALATERPGCSFWATDSSAPALAVARTNAQRLSLDNVHCLAGNWCSALGDNAFDMIVTNPPYIRETDPHLNDPALRCEPRGALAAGPDGLAAIRTIALQARDRLKPGGWLLLEHGYDQGEQTADILAAQGYDEIDTHRDLASQPRVCSARRPQGE